MTPPRFRNARVATLLVAAAWAIGCAREPSSDGPRANAVRVTMSNDPTSLSLVGNTDQWSAQLARLISDGLVDYDGAARFVPRIARSWAFSPDGRTLTFRLREDVRWHDGRPVGADDVVFTINKVREPSTQSRAWAPSFRDLESVEAADPLTVRARYRVASADVLEGWRVPLLPRHILVHEQDLLTSPFARAPVGCGAFRFVRWEPGREVVLDANAAYWDGPPGVSRLIFRILADERTAYRALVRGDIDLLVATPEIWREACSSSEGSRFARFVNHRSAVWYVGWNQDGSNPFFDDPRVRRAMVLALDRDRFMAQVAHGLGRPVATTWLPGSGWDDPAVRPWPFDPVEAARLLDEAGWRDSDGDGTRDRDGVPFAFTFIVPAGGQAIADRMAAWVQDALARIGVAASIERLEWRAFQERRRAHAFQAAMASLFLTPVPDQTELYHSSSRDGGYNYGGFADAETDRILEEGRAILDPVARRAVYARLQARIHALEPLSPLFQFAQPVLHDPRIQGIRPSILGLWDFHPAARAWRWRDASGEARSFR